MLLLDSVCGMLHFIKTQSAVDRIRWWTCWCSIAGSRRGFLKVPVRDWLDAGQSYVELAQEPGAQRVGAPLPARRRVLARGRGRLHELGVPTAAQRKRRQDYMAYDVAGADGHRMLVYPMSDRLPAQLSIDVAASPGGPTHAQTASGTPSPLPVA